MATQAQPAAQNLPPAPTPKKSRKKLWFTITLLLLIAGMGGAGLLLMIQPSTPVSEEEAFAAAEAKRKARPPVFLALEPFVVNLRDDDGDHYLRLGVVLEGTDQEALDVAKQQLPRIRNGILLLLSAKTSPEIATMEGKQRLMDEIIVAARAPMTLPEPNKGIESVYFSDFVIQ